MLWYMLFSLCSLKYLYWVFCQISSSLVPQGHYIFPFTLIDLCQLNAGMYLDYCIQQGDLIF